MEESHVSQPAAFVLGLVVIAFCRLLACWVCIDGCVRFASKVPHARPFDKQFDSVTLIATPMVQGLPMHKESTMHAQAVDHFKSR